MGTQNTSEQPKGLYAYFNVHHCNMYEKKTKKGVVSRVYQKKKNTRKKF